MTISILGCGWLGLPLAEHLIAQGHQLKGSTTTPEKLSKLKTKGIEPWLIELDPKLKSDNCEDFWDAELLIINIPPGRGRENLIEYHTVQVKEIINRIANSPIKKVIFISSTSVYPEQGGVMKEDNTRQGTASHASGEALLKAEQLLMEQNGFETTVLRFGGLYGYDRHPVKYLAGRTGLAKGNAPVNLIHRDDCIGIIETIIKQKVRGEIFNAVSDGHPPRKMYYTEAARKLELEPPEFEQDSRKDYKVVSNQKLKEHLQYRFKYPNPLDPE